MALPPTYVNQGTVAIDAGNLNAINLAIYQLLGDGINAPLTRANILTNLGIGIGSGTMALQNANAVAITGGTLTGVTMPAADLTGTVAVANGGTGDSGTAWTAVTLGALSATTGSGVTGTATARYKTIGKSVFVSIVVTITASGSAAGNYIVAANSALPLPQLTGGSSSVILSGRENAVAGTMAIAAMSSLGQLNIGRYDNTLTGFTTGSVLLFNGVYESV